MARSAKRVERKAAPRRIGRSGTAIVGGIVARNPAAIAGGTGFLVALSFVAVNALWYQPHVHRHALYATRALTRQTEIQKSVEPDTTILIERPSETTQVAISDPTTAKVQEILKTLGFYPSTIDGRRGPATVKAIQDYRRKVGLAASSEIDDDLLDQLGATQTTSAITPVPSPRASQSQEKAPGDAPADKALVAKIQQGLKAFGIDSIEADGVIGSRTKAAIAEFQGLFGLAQTGEPELVVYDKMREIGLTH